MSEISIKLPDGSEKLIAQGATCLDLAKAISEGLARRVMVAKVNGQVRDIQDELHDGDSVELLDTKSPEARDVISHSCEHILAAAVVRLFPDAQVTMGPKNHDDGFYYDFDIGRPFLDEDIAKIENEMSALIKEKIAFKKKWLSKNDALKLFEKLKQNYKPEILDWIPDETVSIYECGDFVDLCRGPHLPNASFIKAFKLLGSSGSYWRGDSAREMLQRINGVAFAKKSELDEYLFRIEEAKKRDHRKLGPMLDLFFVSEKFSHWKDENQTRSEARLVLHAGRKIFSKGKLNKAVKDIEKLLEDIREELANDNLSVAGINTVATQDDSAKVFADLRLYMSQDNAVARKPVEKLIEKFNKKEDEFIKVKYQFETHATEDIGPGLVMWLPKGGKLRSLVEDFSRQKHFDSGYDMVYSPHIAKSDLWRISGHLGFYSDAMFAPMNVDGNEYLLKPMNCPFHVLMYKFKPKSYRDLPVRLAEFGTVYRYEMAGVLHGLMRVRGFTQDDAHIFCRWDQLDDELDKVTKFILKILKAFGFNDFEVNISTKPEKYVGRDEDWQRAEESLKNAVQRSGLNYEVDEGGGAFYGPKIDIKLKDCLGRLWQCSTVQLDFNNPERFNLEFVNDQGEKERPVMLHRALLGSIERFIGVLIEHYAGAFPYWLSPVQARVLTVSDRHNDHAQKVAETLEAAGIRTEFNKSSEKLGAKIRQAQIQKIPFMLIVGDKEQNEQGATLRLRSQEDKGFLSLDELVSQLKELAKIPD